MWCLRGQWVPCAFQAQRHAARAQAMGARGGPSRAAAACLALCLAALPAARAKRVVARTYDDCDVSVSAKAEFCSEQGPGQQCIDKDRQVKESGWRCYCENDPDRFGVESGVPGGCETTVASPTPLPPTPVPVPTAPFGCDVIEFCALYMEAASGECECGECETGYAVGGGGRMCYEATAVPPTPIPPTPVPTEPPPFEGVCPPVVLQSAVAVEVTMTLGTSRVGTPSVAFSVGVANGQWAGIGLREAGSGATQMQGFDITILDGATLEVYDCETKTTRTGRPEISSPKQSWTSLDAAAYRRGRAAFEIHRTLETNNDIAITDGMSLDVALAVGTGPFPTSTGHVADALGRQVIPVRIDACPAMKEVILNTQPPAPFGCGFIPNCDLYSPGTDPRAPTACTCGRCTAPYTQTEAGLCTYDETSEPTTAPPATEVPVTPPPGTSIPEGTTAPALLTGQPVQRDATGVPPADTGAPGTGAPVVPRATPLPPRAPATGTPPDTGSSQIARPSTPVTLPTTPVPAEDGLPYATILGAAAGGVLLIAMVIAVVCCLVRRGPQLEADTDEFAIPDEYDYAERTIASCYTQDLIKDTSALDLLTPMGVRNLSERTPDVGDSSALSAFDDATGMIMESSHSKQPDGLMASMAKMQARQVPAALLNPHHASLHPSPRRYTQGNHPAGLPLRGSFGRPNPLALGNMSNVSNMSMSPTGAPTADPDAGDALVDRSRMSSPRVRSRGDATPNGSSRALALASASRRKPSSSEASVSLTSSNKTRRSMRGASGISLTALSPVARPVSRGSTTLVDRDKDKSSPAAQPPARGRKRADARVVHRTSDGSVSADGSGSGEGSTPEEAI